MDECARLIGIAGGIGSGKSYVSRILRCLGYPVYDCDIEARRIMDSSCAMRDSICVRFGDGCLLPGGGLDRRAIAARIFDDDEARLWLNALVHGAVREDVGQWKRNNPSPLHGLLFVESAILSTSGLADMCSSIWLVTTPEEVRISRVETRSGLARGQILARMASQKEEEDMLERKSGACPVRLICNDGVRPLLREVEKLLKEEITKG